MYGVREELVSSVNIQESIHVYMRENIKEDLSFAPFEFSGTCEESFLFEVKD